MSEDCPPRSARDGVSESARRAGERAKGILIPYNSQAPEGPLFRRGPNSLTSQEGARYAAGRSRSIGDRILQRLECGPASPEELAVNFAELGERILLNTIRARCSDLFRTGRVRPSGTFGRGESGKVRVIRWRLSSAEELSQFLARKAVEDEKGEHPHG